jgi:peptidoglycan hydrolase CwlO-like protein
MKMTYIKELQNQIAELNKRIQQNQGDVVELQSKINKLMIDEFEESMREESDNQQLLKG